MSSIGTRCLKQLRVAIIGRPNVGKSTLLNQLVGYKISGVSNKVHTTRDNILGVLTKDNVQIEFVDSPGIVSRDHAKKHKLEQAFHHAPLTASNSADVIAVVADASSSFGSSLKKETIDILEAHKDKKSILILNKTDLVKEKRKLLNLSTRLSRGCIDGKLIADLEKVSFEDKVKLNIVGTKLDNYRSSSKYVIELEPDNIVPPRQSGFTNFSRIFLLSALNNEGVDDLLDFLLECAKDVPKWNYKENFITNSSKKQVVKEIIRGKIMDYTDNAVPYNISFRFKHCDFDELDCLVLYLEIVCPHNYERNQVAANFKKIAPESREIISNTLGCDVKMTIAAVTNTNA